MSYYQFSPPPPSPPPPPPYHAPAHRQMKARVTDALVYVPRASGNVAEEMALRGGLRVPCVTGNWTRMSR